jgi:uncharacterized iron-regulated membrane protein
MNGLIRKIHIYAGLLTFTQLLIYGLAGVISTFQPSLERSKTPYATRYEAFTAPASASDKEVAERYFQHLKLPLTRPVPGWFIKRTAENNLLLDFYNINGIYRVVVLEKEGRLRIENIRNNGWLFLEDIHASTLGDGEAPRIMRLWAVWNEIGLWSLLGFCISGAWLWLSSRPRFAWAWAALGCGFFALVSLWEAFR